jgi:glycosyltransferase involved in cell wall biosynthesis
VLQLAAFDEPHLTEQVLALSVALSNAGEDVTTAGPLDDALRLRLSHLNLPWARVTFSEPGQKSRAESEELARVLGTGAFTVVHAHDLPAIELAAAALARLGTAGRTRLVGCLHYVPRDLAGLPRWREARRLRRLLRTCNGFVVSSLADREALAQLAGSEAETADVVYPIVTPRSQLSSAEAGFLRHRLGVSGHAAVVGFSSGFPGTEAVVFLPAARQVLEDLGNVEFIVLGQGPGLVASQQLAHELGLTGATLFMPTPRSLPETISLLNVLVVLGDTGGAHVDALQALQFGVPVVTAPLGALREILPLFPQTQVLAEVTPERVAEAIQSALHVVPPAGLPLPGEAGAVPSLPQFLGRDSDWLGEAWAHGETPVPRTSAEGLSALGQYGPDAVVKQVRELYLRVLSPH